ncbi:MAG: division/cell wall cluster transcriptional repressor MraZ [Planctomycetota bacterium]|jgi:MraZ protein
MAFTGHHERTIDSKNRLQIPSQFRNAIDVEREGPGLYAVLGERRHTLALVTERQFEELARRIQTEFMSNSEALDFEQRFYSTASYVEMDKQGRVVLPDYLASRARIKGEVVLAGAKYRIDIWRRADFEAFMGIDWEHDWPNWQRFLRGKHTDESRGEP